MINEPTAGYELVGQGDVDGLRGFGVPVCVVGVVGAILQAVADSAAALIGGTVG